MHTLATTYYSPLIPQDSLMAILDNFEASEQDQAAELICKNLDYAVFNQLLPLLPTESDRIAFVQLVTQEYTAAAPLEWLKAKLPDSQTLLQQTIERTLLNLGQKLSP